MTIKDIIDFVDRNLGQSIATIGGRKSFRVQRKGDKAFLFITENGNGRNENHDWIGKSLRIFNQTGSLKTTDYPITQNASYVLALFKAVREEKTQRQSTRKFGNSYCEMWSSGSWIVVPVESILNVQGLTIRCLECKGPIRLHGAGRMGKPRSHAEHKQHFPGCSLGNCFDGSHRLNPNAIEAPVEENRNPGTQFPFPDLDLDSVSGKEGKGKWVQHFRRERDRGLTKQKKQKVLAETGKLLCEACSFDFAMIYGPVGKNFCEVHHRKPLGNLKAESKTYLKDLAIICSNCHRIIHRIKPMPSVETFAAMLRERNSRKSKVNSAEKR